MITTIVIAPGEAGCRLDRVLAERAATSGAGEPLHGLSRARLQSLIEESLVRVDGRVARASSRLKGGERVAVEVPPAVPIALAPEPMHLDVLYEDSDMIAIAKPAGIAVHPGAGRSTGTLVSGLLFHCRDLSGIGGELRPGIVHRLDSGTSGVLVVAKHDRAHVGLARQFAARAVVKRYVAFVLGSPSPIRQTVETFYGRHPTSRLRFTSRVTSGKKAVTSFVVTATVGGVSRLDVLLCTGRTHQIRVHLSDLGHPVLGDPLYGGRRLARVSDSELRELAGALTHQALHAAVLELRHPISSVPLRFEAPLPPDLAAIDNRIARIFVPVTGSCRDRGTP